MRNLLLFGLLVFVAFACKKKTEDPPDVGYAYAPENIGKYIVYDVDSTIYDDFFDEREQEIFKKIQENKRSWKRCLWIIKVERR